MKGMFRTVTVGHPEKLRKSVFYTIVSYLVNIVPFGVSIEVVRTVFAAWSAGGAPDMARLWGLSAFLLVWMLVMFAAEIPAYQACYWDAYEASARGRADLAEKLRRLPLGYFARRDPGDLVNMIMGDFLLLETAISHQVPQMVSYCPSSPSWACASGTRSWPSPCSSRSPWRRWCSCSRRGSRTG